MGDHDNRDDGQHDVELPVRDLRLRGGGEWQLSRSVNWKRSGVTEFRGQPVLRVVYEKNSGTSADPGVGGIIVCAVPRGLPCRRAAAVAFDVFFAPGWHFSKGGKLGGLFMGQGKASGYRHSPTSSSHRIMWQAGGGAIAYIYPPADLPQEDPRLRASGCGVGYFKDLFPAGTLKPGRWNRVVLGVQLNSFGPDGEPAADGVATLAINGTTGRKADIRWVRSPDLAIESFELNTFFGGPDPSVVDCTAYFRDFRLMTPPAL